MEAKQSPLRWKLLEVFSLMDIIISGVHQQIQLFHASFSGAALRMNSSLSMRLNYIISNFAFFFHTVHCLHTHLSSCFIKHFKTLQILA